MRRRPGPPGCWTARFCFCSTPKAYAIIALMFTQFLPSAQHIRGATLLISTVFTLNNLIAFLIWAAAGNLLGRWFRSAGSARVLNLVFGASLAGVALWMLLR